MSITSLPIAERVINAVIEELRKVRLEDGYFTDAGAFVSRSVPTPEADDSAQFVVFEEGEETPDGGGNKIAMTMTLRLSVVGLVPAASDENGTQAGLVKADIKRCLLNADGRSLSDSGGKLGSLTYLRCVTRSREDGASGEAVVASFEINYTEVKGDPTSHNRTR
jgi:hypothetical protein